MCVCDCAHAGTGVEFRDVAGLGPILNEVVEVVEVSACVCAWGRLGEGG